MTPPVPSLKQLRQSILACRLDLQVIRDAHQFSQRFGFHLGHYAGSVNFDGLLARTELGTHLFVE